jgi:hypothetical protein
MFRNVKNHATQGYHKTKDFLNKVDHGVSIAKRVYSQIAPILDKFVGGHGNQHVMKALGGYESLRNRVMDGHEKVVNNVNQAMSGLKKHVPELGL